MKLLRESTGDVKLAKFICINSPMIPNETKNYYSEVGCYFFIHKYIYNTISQQLEFVFEHSDMIEAFPKPIRELLKTAKWYHGSLGIENGGANVLGDKFLEFYEDSVPEQILKFIVNQMKEYNFKKVYMGDQGEVSF